MKWGILATGTIAKKFASTVEQMGAEGEQLVAVGSRHLESAQAFAQQYGIPRCYDSYEALAADPEVEAIYIATPNTLHYENCKLCLEQGKHVLCEKPFTISPEQAQELYRLAEEKHLFLMEAFWIWLLPLYDRLRQILTAGTIGELSRSPVSTALLPPVPGRIASLIPVWAAVRCWISASTIWAFCASSPDRTRRRWRPKRCTSTSTAPTITAALR